MPGVEPQPPCHLLIHLETRNPLAFIGEYLPTYQPPAFDLAHHLCNCLSRHLPHIRQRIQRGNFTLLSPLLLPVCSRYTPPLLHLYPRVSALKTRTAPHVPFKRARADHLGLLVLTTSDRPNPHAYNVLICIPPRHVLHPLPSNGPRPASL